MGATNGTTATAPLSSVIHSDPEILGEVRVAVVVMQAASNRLADLMPLVPAVPAALGSIQPGDAVEIPA
jgi:hypothetical protein